MPDAKTPPAPSVWERLGRWWRVRLAWRTVSSSYSGTYQENAITGARRYIEGPVWERGRPHAPPDIGWLQGLPFGEWHRRNPQPPPTR